MNDFSHLSSRVKAVAIGGSAGGIEALMTMLPAIPATTHVPVLVVVHISRERESLMPQIFAARCTRAVKEAEDKELVAPDTLYFAAPDYHLQVDVGADRVPRVSLSYDDPIHWSRPSIDALFSSAADVYGAALMAILLSGGNQDGAAGLRAVREAGGITVVQDPASSLCPTMPNEGLRLVSPDFVLAPEEMKPLLQALS